MSKKKLLYIACHITAEADDLEMFSNLGFECVSIGNFTVPKKPFHKENVDYGSMNWTKHDWKEPQFSRDGELTTKFLTENPLFDGITTKLATISKEFLNNFDLIIISGYLYYLKDLIPKINYNKTRLLFNTVGQTGYDQELVLKKYRDRLLLNRYAPTESRIQYCGCSYSEADSYIHGSVNKDFEIMWSGEVPEIMTIARGILERAGALNYPIMLDIMSNLNSKMYGQGNEKLPSYIRGGSLSYEQLIKTYQSKRCFLAGGICPGPISYTFLEAMFVGTPIIALGQNLATHTAGMANFYNIHSYITNGVDGFVSDSIPELKEVARSLLNDYNLAAKISKEGAKKARNLFSQETIQSKWKELFIRKGIL